MGVNLRDIASPKKIDLNDLGGRRIAIDAFNTLYQFLSIIRGETGDLLKDGHGRVTSHLSGLFYRNVNLIESGIRLVYVFDGESPKLKHAEIQRRREIKQVAAQKYEEAIEREDFESAKKFASATAYLDQEMVKDSKKLLELMGIPWIQAPSEGEATAAHLTQTGVVDYAGSQDYDSLLFGATRLARNITISGKRRLPGKNFRIDVVPEVIILSDVLSQNQITREQLIEVAMILGTDFNYADFKGIGPKTALKLVKKYGRVEEIPELKGNINFEPEEVRDIFLHPKVSDASQETVQEKEPDDDALFDFLVREHDFSEERIKSSLARISKKREHESQSLEQWFK
ncbi:MAG TPA: flap endonuclease-1 [Nitrososphaerales archaeon]|nr:flap endonuclease-1 [Nitrososphaerales archaeon]